MNDHISLRSFWQNRDGSISIMMGLVFLAVVSAMGGAIDLSNAMNKRVQAQHDLDAALLSSFRNPDSLKMTTPQREKLVRDFMGDTFDGFPADAAITVTQNGDTYSANTDFASNNIVLNVFGIKTFGIDVTSKVTLSQPPPMELALVIDTTSSMAYGNKLETMKGAAHDLVATLSEYETVRIALVPFSQHINVGMGNRNAAGLDIPEDVPDQEICTSTPDMTYSNCRTVDSTCSNTSCSDYMDTCTEDGVQKSCSKQDCRPGPAYQCTKPECDSTPSGTYTTSCRTVTGPKWRGCVGSREYPANSRDSMSGGDVPGFLEGACAQPLVRLTDNGASILSVIDSFSTAGETFIAPALLWGARMISTNVPFPDGSSDPTMNKAIVLMSDGANTISKLPGEAKHTGTDRAAADALLLETCTNLKAQDITIYTVAYDIDDAAGRKLLQDCASEGRDTFFDARTDAQLVESFETISRGFQSVRVSQ